MTITEAAELVSAVQRREAAEVQRVERVRRFLSLCPGVRHIEVVRDGSGRKLRAQVWFAPTPDGLPRRRLPDGTVIAELNGYETDYLYQEIMVDRVYAPDGLVLPPDAVVVDIGANIGMFSLFVSGWAPGCRVLALEPNPYAYAALTANVAMLGLPVTCLPWAVGGASGPSTMTVYPSASVYSGLHADTVADQQAIRAAVSAAVNAAVNDTTSDAVVDDVAASRVDGAIEIPVEVRSLPDILQLLDTDRVDLVKLDVERAELAILRELSAADWAAIQHLIMEVHTDADVRAALALLERAGFETVVNQHAALNGTEFTNLYAWHRGSAVHPLRTRPIRLPGPVPALPPLELARHALAAFLGPDVDTVELVLGTGDPPTTPAVAGATGAAVPAEVLAAVTTAWQHTLGVERIGPNDDFFDLGGSSLMAVRMLARLRGEHGYKIGLDEFLLHPSCAALASLCTRHSAPL